MLFFLGFTFFPWYSFLYYLPLRSVRKRRISSFLSVPRNAKEIRSTPDSCQCGCSWAKRTQKRILAETARFHKNLKKSSVEHSCEGLPDTWVSIHCPENDMFRNWDVYSVNMPSLCMVVFGGVAIAGLYLLGEVGRPVIVVGICVTIVVRERVIDILNGTWKDKPHFSR